MLKTLTEIAIAPETKQFLNILYHDYIENESDYEGNQFCLTTCDGWDKKLKAINFRTLVFKNKDKRYRKYLNTVLKELISFYILFN